MTTCHEDKVRFAENVSGARDAPGAPRVACLLQKDKTKDKTGEAEAENDKVDEDVSEYTRRVWRLTRHVSAGAEDGGGQE